MVPEVLNPLARAHFARSGFGFGTVFLSVVEILLHFSLRVKIAFGEWLKHSNIRTLIEREKILYIGYFKTPRDLPRGDDVFGHQMMYMMPFGIAEFLALKISL